MITVAILVGAIFALVFALELLNALDGAMMRGISAPSTASRRRD